MKLIIIIILILALLAFFYYTRIKEEISDLKFDFDLNAIDVSSFNLNDLLLGEGGKLKANVKFIVENQGRIPISFSNLNIQIKYKDKLIGQTSKEDINNFRKIKINPYYINGGITVESQIFDVYVNKELIELIGLIKSNLNPSIYYSIGISVYGLKIKKDSLVTIKN